jgi:hypothetical protein
MLYEEQKGCKGVHFSMLAIGFVVANSWTVLKPQTFIKLMSPFLIPVLLECGREKLTDVFELSNYATKLFFSPPNKVANLGVSLLLFFFLSPWPHFDNDGK